MKKRTFYASAITAILAVLGFSGCGNDSFVVMYGIPSPYSSFKLKATVKNEKNEPIEGIEIHVVDELKQRVSNDVNSDRSGVAELKVSCIPDEQTFKVYAIDKDGADNGSYRKDSAEVVVKIEDFSSDHLYREKAAKEVTIVMKEDKVDKK